MNLKTGGWMETSEKYTVGGLTAAVNDEREKRANKTLMSPHLHWASQLFTVSHNT